MDLAYLFWHWPQPRTDEALYTARLASFHKELAKYMPYLYGSRVVRMDPPPGIPISRPVYLDWYVVQSWEAIGLMNQEAAYGQTQPAHDAVAPLAADGAGAIYAVRGNAADALISAVWSYWFSKPKGMSYTQLDELLAPYLADYNNVLWQRQMVLGPAPEFCLTTAVGVVLPENLTVHERKLAPIYP